jgi:hypothetical protein
MNPDRSTSPLIRSKTAAQWTAEDPYLHRGDLGVESDTGREKIGLGAPWSATSYVPAGSYGDLSGTPTLNFVPTASPPASASATGTAGQLAYDSSYLYICTATDTWMRVAIATWP